MPIKVEEYVRADGTSLYRVWFDGLDVQAAALAKALHAEYKTRKSAALARQRADRRKE